MTNSDRIRRPRRVRRWHTLRAGLLLLVLASAGHAQDAESPRFSFDGFGTLGWVHSDEENADFDGGLSFLQHSGAGYTHAWSAEVDSRLGLQLTAQFTPRLSGVLQVISEQQHDGSYRPRVEWANLRFELTPDLDLRVGRTVLASFLVSDFRKVGYINPWVRPPVEVYTLLPATNGDGVDLNWRHAVGSVTHTLHADYGHSELSLAIGGKAHARQAWGVSETLQSGALTARISYRQTALSLDSFNTLFDAFRQFGPEGIAIAERYDADGGTFRFAGLGATYDPGDWFLTGEWGRIQSRTAIGKRSAWYASTGYRWHDFTPYVTYAQTRKHGKREASGLTVANYPPQLTQAVLGLNAVLADVVSIPVQKTVSLGARWDFHENFALKLQYDHTQLGPGSIGILGNIQPGFEPGGNLDLLTICADFVF
jgi:opacity protein-like surface antigen